MLFGEYYGWKVTWEESIAVKEKKTKKQTWHLPRLLNETQIDSSKINTDNTFEMSQTTNLLAHPVA